MKRTFFDLAYKFAENKQNDELKLQICKEAGDHYYNKNNFEKAEIIVLQAMIKRNQPNEYCDDFIKFMNHLKQQFL